MRRIISIATAALGLNFATAAETAENAVAIKAQPRPIDERECLRWLQTTPIATKWTEDKRYAELLFVDGRDVVQARVELSGVVCFRSELLKQ